MKKVQVVTYKDESELLDLKKELEDTGCEVFFTHRN